MRSTDSSQRRLDWRTFAIDDGWGVRRQYSSANSSEGSVRQSLGTDSKGDCNQAHVRGHLYNDKRRGGGGGAF